MKNITFPLLAASLAISTIIGCKKEAAKPAPIAEFSYFGNSSPAPCTVSFSNTSKNATSYKWDFGDNSTSTQKDPSHVYTMGGVYTVTLTATGEGGSNSVTKTINIQVAPTKCLIKSITLTAMPFTDANGTGWDPFDGPDVFPMITDNASVTLLDGTNAKRDNVISTSLPIKWNLTTPFEITPLNVKRGILLYDFDSLDPNDYIGGVGFTPSLYTSGYPTSLQLSYQGVSFTLDVQWQ